MIKYLNIKHICSLQALKDNIQILNFSLELHSKDKSFSASIDQKNYLIEKIKIIREMQHGMNTFELNQDSLPICRYLAKYGLIQKDIILRLCSNIEKINFKKSIQNFTEILYIICLAYSQFYLDNKKLDISDEILIEKSIFKLIEKNPFLGVDYHDINFNEKNFQQFVLLHISFFAVSLFWPSIEMNNLKYTFLYNEQFLNYIRSIKLKQILKRGKSKAQGRVSKYLSYRNIQFAEEAEIEFTYVDFSIKPKKLIEINGPSHFLQVIDRPLGKHILKEVLLRKLGYDLLNINYNDKSNHIQEIEDFLNI